MNERAAQSGNGPGSAARGPGEASHREDGAVAGRVSGAMRIGGVDVAPSALRFSFVASSGPGGQNVNKRRTRAELRVWVRDLGLDPAAAERLRAMSGPMGAGLVTEAGELIIECDEHRSQGRNKDEAVERLERLIRAAVARPKVRKPTKPSKGAKRRRLEDKKQRGAIKKRRSGGGEE
ncbi:MAG: aminoacyl-tRNA hydrolase [Phycisphaeraceae bacterium]|nr:MAG: aminoacyl-tRNA hydrolase [Phycisphaeraceae bacterium]